MRGSLGRPYEDGEVIVRQGDTGDCMFVIQHGEVEVVHAANGQESVVAVLGAGECFGEMAIFERETRSATVRARGQARVLTVDKKTLLRRFQEDPTLGLNLLRTLSQRIRRMDRELSALRRRPGEEHGDA